MKDERDPFGWREDVEHHQESNLHAVVERHLMSSVVDERVARLETTRPAETSLDDFGCWGRFRCSVDDRHVGHGAAANRFEATLTCGTRGD